MPKNPPEEICKFCNKKVPGGRCSTQHEADNCPDNYPDDEDRSVEAQEDDSY